VDKIRVLIVDDSSFVRKALSRIFSSDPQTEVVGTAGSGAEAIEKVLALKPDVLTLDIIMPGMDGLETLKNIMEKRPTPVLMLSQLTRQGAEMTLKALELGALDFVDKSSAGMMDFLDLGREILLKVKSIVGSKLIKVTPQQQAVSHVATRSVIDVVAIGTSTGGPIALQMLLPKFQENVNFGLLVVQHMPRGFTETFAKRLDAICNIRVREAEEGDVVQSGLALVAPAGLHMTVRKTKGEDAVLRHQVTLSLNPPEMIHRPSADVLFRSVAENFGRRSIGVIMTGMGSDGAQGLKELRDSGGFTIAQDEATSAIFGMPRAAIDIDAADIVVPLTSIADEILLRA